MVTRSTRPRTTANGGGLSGKRLDMLREMLIEQRQFRLEQLTGDTALRRPSTEADLEVQATIMIGAHSALRDVEEALERMRRGTYGRCTECSAQLPVERLEIVPQAALCMPCQHRQDSRRTPTAARR